MPEKMRAEGKTVDLVKEWARRGGLLENLKEALSFMDRYDVIQDIENDFGKPILFETFLTAF